jgi:hypothetical protein
MKSIAGLLLLAIISLFWTSSTASAQFDDGWWFLEFKDTTGAALQPLNVGIDARDGRGFGFVTVADDDGDGVIHLPPLPNGGGLAMGVDVDGEVVETQTHGGIQTCDIWIVTGGGATGGTVAQIHHPLLIRAEDIEGEALGMGPFFPYPQIPLPIRTLEPGERLTATDGQLADWPGLRLVEVSHAALNFLDEYIEQVDTLPNFNGEVIVTSLLLTGTFVPEPASATILVTLVGLLTLRRRPLNFGRRCSVNFRERNS